MEEKIILKNITFKSKRKACEYFDVNYNSVMKRIERGWSIEEAFELVKRKQKNKIPITVESKTFESIKEACRYYKLNSGTVSQRIREGWSVEEAFELIERKPKFGKTIIVNGKTFTSIKEACEYYNIRYNTAIARYSYGWSVEEIFELTKRKSKGRKPITVDEKTFKSIKEACRYYKLSYNTIKTRLRRGWSAEEAFGLIKKCI